MVARIVKGFSFLVFFFAFAALLQGCNPNNQLDYKDFSDLFILNAEEQLSQDEPIYYLYFYGKDCRYCMEIKQELLEKVSNIKNSTIYFVEYLGKGSVNENIDLNSLPTLFKIENQLVVNEYKGATQVIEKIRDLD